MNRNVQLLGIALLAVVWGVNSVAQSPNSSTSSASASISGQIVRSGTGDPIKKALVTLQPVTQIQAQPIAPAAPGQNAVQQQGRGGGQRGQQQKSVLTGNDGSFVLDGVGAGTYRLFAEHDGYLRQAYGQRSASGSGTIISISDGQKLAGISVQMLPAGTISGRILNEDGEPVAGIQVQALTYIYQNGNRTLAPGKQTQTNDLGEYRLYWMTPAEYYISAIPQAFRQPNLVNPSDESYAPTYYPGGIEPESATPISLPAAAEIRGIDFTLRPVKTVKVRGRIVTPSGLAPQQSAAPQPGQRGPGPAGNPGQGLRGGGVQVALSRAGTAGRGGRGFGGQAQSRTSVSADGTFEISNVIPGSYTLTAVQQSQNQLLSARARVEVNNSDIDNVSLSLGPGTSISGQIYLDGTPTQQFQMSRLRVALNPSEDVPLGNTNAQVKDDGTFVLNNVAAMNYRVNVNGLTGGSYLIAGKYGSADALGDFLQVNGSGVPLSLQIGFSTGRVDGSLTDSSGQASTGATVVLIPTLRNRLDLYKTASADQYGRFSFANVAPGDYKAFAWEDVPQGAYQDPAFVGRYEDRGTTVHVDRNGSSAVQLQMIPAASR